VKPKTGVKKNNAVPSTAMAAMAAIEKITRFMSINLRD